MSLVLPEWKTESEEADWWFDHREEVEADFLLAAAEGRLERDGKPLPSQEIDRSDLIESIQILKRAGHLSEEDAKLKREQLLPLHRLQRAG